ncbi:DUF3631 domain-containing protein [Bifidobacterium vespertilionis]|uniref:DUF3631 domain-containing protein n=1 Tax=Bifidobacterium vespertilionis TaxID=2562524 RepID=A0A5J5E410_9BIFI|nr:DUF3631 domain-containing protein [Bifidobacterium vespertilionis]KAA8821157.1 DUF3631 domain-containing protein [Bifidobacterium vespertilionis]KAA8823612.1 DUF3631 domain-containing protein [Bifidobacterium vespertilionis]
MIETMNPADLGSMNLIADDPFISDEPVGMPGLPDVPYAPESFGTGDYGFDPSGLANRIFRLLKRYIGATDDDLKMLTLWIMHTWVFASLYTTPRLLVTSILPGAGKTTLLEWIGHLGAKSEMLSAISSASLLANLADQGYTLLVDEADRSLRKDNPLAADFIAVVNTGYKKGGSRTIQEPDKKHGWKVVRKSTHAPAVFAGNNPDLPADTRQRCIPVFLYPSDEVEESDWEMIEEDDAEFLDLRHDLPIWAETAASAIKPRPTLPESVKGRYREVWLPLARIAQTQSGDWLDTVRRLSAEFVEQAKTDADLGLANDSPHIVLLKDIAELWATQWQTCAFVGSQQMCDALAYGNPTQWGDQQAGGFGRLTAKRLASMLKKAGVEASRNRERTKRGYRFTAFAQAWETLKIWEALKLEPPTPGMGASADADASDGSDTSDASTGSTLESISANASKNDSEPERLEHWAATLSTTADIPDWTALSAGQLQAIRKVKHTGLWLNKTTTELNRRGIIV